jgi:hypothetical protein
VISHHDPLWGLNAGFIALAVNAIVLVGGSLLFPDHAAPEVMAAYAPGEAPRARVPESAPADGGS